MHSHCFKYLSLTVAFPVTHNKLFFSEDMSFPCCSLTLLQALAFNVMTILI